MRINSETKMPAHFASKMEKPSSLQETRQWKSRIASEEKVAYGGRRNKKREKRAEVARFVDDLRNKLLEIVHLKGGTEFSILRHTFLDWDKDRSGELGLEEFKNAMRTIGVRGSDETFNAVIDHFDVDGDGEMRYEPLVDEVVKGSRHWLEHPSTADVREENKRRMANGEGGNGKSAIVNLELAKVMLKNSPGLKGYDQLQSPYGSARSSTLSSARSSILSTARKSVRSTSGRSSARSTSRGESREVIESLQRQLQEERKRREEVEKELEDERKKRAEAGSSAAAGGDSKISQSQEEKEEKGGAKGEDEELRKFKAFKSQGGVVR